jgi:hypothetical protein
MIVLFDAAHFPTVKDQSSWEEELVADEDIARHIRAGHLVPLHAGADGRYRVEVRLGGELSSAEEKKSTARSRPYLLDSKGSAYLGGLEHVHAKPGAPASAFALPVGRWAATVVRLSGKGTPDVVVLLALAKGKAFETDLDPFAKTDAEARKAALAAPPTRIKTLKQALEAAVQGRVDEALPALTIFAEKGAAPARAAVAQIRAYRGDWNGVLDAVTRLLADPKDIYAGNVLDDAKWLLLRAARETGRWKDADTAIAKQKKLGEGKLVDPIGKHIRAQARAGGSLDALPFDLGVLADKMKRPLSERERHFTDAMAGLDAPKKKKKEQPGARETAAFNYASGYGLPERALAAWPAAEPHFHWDQAVDAARLYATAGKREEAWGVLSRKIRHFWPVDAGQVAPVEPVADPALWPLLTRERAAELLATPKSKDL